MRQAQVDAAGGTPTVLSSAEREELRWLRGEVRELRQKVLIAAWHVLSREQPFNPAAVTAAPILSRPAPTFIWPPDGPQRN